MIEAALSRGFNAIGFSDHSYAPEQVDYCMPSEKVKANYEEILALQEEYRGRIAVYAGIEFDGDSALPEIDYDYVLASVHEMHHRGKSYPVDFSAAVQLELANDLFGGSMVKYSRAYYESLVNHVARCKPDIIGLSGLITPSLAEMVNVAKALRNADINTPLLIGGATTSAMHTALKIAPAYNGPVVYVRDASQNSGIAATLLSEDSREAFISHLNEEQEMLRRQFAAKEQSPLLTIEEARSKKPNFFDIK
jgi:hypothetical protein